MKKIFAELKMFRLQLLCVFVSVAAGVGATLGSAEGSGVAVLSRTGSGRVGTALSAALTPTQ